MGFPWSLLWLLPSVHQLFVDCSHAHYPWDTPTDTNLGGSSLVNTLCGSTDEALGGECAAHSISHFLLISLSLNRSLSQARELFVVWGVAPILPEPLFISIYTSAWVSLHRIFMFFPKCAPNGILGVEDTLAYVTQNCQWLTHIPPMGFPWSLLWLLPGWSLSLPNLKKFDGTM
jgi:hypothetical protein